MENMQPAVEKIGQVLAQLHDDLFTDDVHLTLIARLPEDADADIVMSDDDLVEVAGVIARAIDREDDAITPNNEYKKLSLLVKPDGSFFAVGGDSDTSDDDEFHYPALDWLCDRIDSAQEDATLFNFWIAMAANQPAKVAKAIANCTAPDEYRQALIALATETFNEDQT